MNKNNKNFIKNILKILKVKYLTSGLEISDNIIRYLDFDYPNIKIFGIKISPGIISGGKILNYKLFIESLLELKRKILGEKKIKENINVAVCLSSANFYIQNFSLPLIFGKDFENAVNLNMKMIAPEKEDKVYSSWQIIEENKQLMRREILAVFIDKSLIDLLNKALSEVNFNIRSIEPQPISLLRFFNKKLKNFDINKKYLVLKIDDSGIKNLIIRDGNLYFYYFSTWYEILKDKREINWYDFEIFLIRHIHQVFNFYNSKWNDQLDGLYLITSVFKEEIKKSIQQNFSFPILDLVYDFDDQISLDWITVFGVYLRGEIPFHKDREISLLGIEAAEKFVKYQMIKFFNFWKLFFLGAVSLIIIEFIVSFYFLYKINNSLKIESINLLGDSRQLKEINDLQKKVENFNSIVNVIKNIESNYLYKIHIIQKINQKLLENDIILDSLSFNNQNRQVSMLLSTKDENNISRFKKSLENDNFFNSVNLPLSDIKRYEDKLIFSISFVVNFSNIE